MKKPIIILAEPEHQQRIRDFIEWYFPLSLDYNCKPMLGRPTQTWKIKSLFKPDVILVDLPELKDLYRFNMARSYGILMDINGGLVPVKPVFVFFTSPVEKMPGGYVWENTYEIIDMRSSENTLHTIYKFIKSNTYERSNRFQPQLEQ